MRSSSPFVLVVAACVAPLIAAPAAWASQPAGPPPAAAAPPAPTAADKAEAQRLYVEGKALRAQEKLPEALDRFRRSHDLAPTPVTRLELARALETAGRLIEAHQLADSVASLPVTPTETAKGRAARADAAALAGQLARRIPRATITVAGAGPDEVVEVLLDGRPLSKELLGGEQDVEPGAHLLVARAGERTAEQSFTVREGERVTVELALPTPPPALAPPAPASATQATPAPAAGRPVAPPRVPVHDDGTSPAVPIAFTIAGVALGTGIATGAVALVQARELKEACANGACPPAQHDLLGTHQAVAATSTIAFAIAGAAAAVGVVVLVVDGSDEPSGAATLRLRWAGTGVAAEGTWK